MRVYISGPITNNPNFMAEFDAAADALWAAGHKPINPAKLCTVLPDGTHEEYMSLCYELFLKADAVYFLKGWSKSEGASREYLWAREFGTPICDRYGNLERET